MEEAYIYIQTIRKYMKIQWLHLTPTKMGLALHCHGELKLTKMETEEKEIQRGRWSCSHKP